MWTMNTTRAGSAATGSARCAVLAAARGARADLLLLVGDTFESNRVPTALVVDAARALEDYGGQVVILPGNHDPVVEGAVYHHPAMTALSNVSVLGVTHEEAVLYERFELEVWGRAHRHYGDMDPLAAPPPRAARWRIALAHGHYEASPDRVPSARAPHGCAARTRSPRRARTMSPSATGTARSGLAPAPFPRSTRAPRLRRHGERGAPRPVRRRRRAARLDLPPECWRRRRGSRTERPRQEDAHLSDRHEQALKSLSEISLEGRVAIVTGAARGLGHTMALALCRAGANVVFLDIDGEEADRVAHEAAGQPDAGSAMGLACDIRDLRQCREAVARTIEAFGASHILVNNAALGPTHVERAPQTRSSLFHETDPQAWADVIEVNVTGTFFMAHAAAHALIAAGWGRIINITTSLATMQRGANSPYGVTKAAIEAETLIWAQDLKGTGVTVNSLIPAGRRTPISSPPAAARRSRRPDASCCRRR